MVLCDNCLNPKPKHGSYTTTRITRDDQQIVFTLCWTCTLALNDFAVLHSRYTVDRIVGEGTRHCIAESQQPTNPQQKEQP